jgi:hypothetical protein
LLSEKEDTRQRTEETHQRRSELFDRVASDPELSRIESVRGVGRALFDRFPEEWSSADAAKQAFIRAKGSKGQFIGGVWRLPEAA